MADLHCYLAAFLFILGSILDIVYMVRLRNFGPYKNFEEYENLNPEDLQLEWDFRLQNEGLDLASGLVNSVAWFVFVVPVIKMAWIQSGGGTRQVGTLIMIVVLAIGGSSCELVARLLSIGCNSALNWLAADFNLSNWTSETSGDNYGLRTLVMIDVALSGLMLWIDAIECLFLSGIFILLLVSILRTDVKDMVFGKIFAWYGFVLALFGIVQFATSVLRMSNWMRYSNVALGIGGSFRLVLLPLWLAWLSCQLPKVEITAGTKKDKERRHIMIDDSERSYGTPS
jgi:hypothetical protein